MRTIDGDKLRGHLETLILAALERSEAHGLEILRRLEIGGCGLLRLKEGSLYPALYRLEAAGEIKATWEEESHGRRGARRRIYSLTSKGHRKLARGRDEWQSFVMTLGGIFRSAGVTPRDADMMGNFSDEACTILAAAEREARQFNHEYVGTEHILLAIVGEKSGLLAETLQSLGVRADAIRGEVEKLVQCGDSPISLQDLSLTPRARQVLEFANEEARYWSQKQVGVEHLFIGLVREQDGVAGHVLRNLGFEQRELAREVLKSRVQQMKIVERAVRPVRAGTPCKRRMREELLAHLTDIFEQEMSRVHNPNEAIEEAVRRFGDPSELSRELEATLPHHERISYWMERWFAWRAPESIVRYSLRLARLSFVLLLLALGVVGIGITTRYGWVPEVKTLWRVFASILIVVPAAQFAVGVLYYWMRDSMWGVFGSRKSVVHTLAFDGLIALVVTGGFAGLIGLATWDGSKAIDSLSICGFAGLAAAMIWLATARFTGPSEIRDTVWAYLDVDSAE